MVIATQDTQAELPQNGIRYPEGFPYKDRESAEARLGMELDKARTMIQSDEGRKELIEKLSLNGNANKVLEGIDLNVEQLKKKEGFLKKMLKLPGRTLKATLGLMKRHPVISVLILLALAAGGVATGLYFTGNLELFLTKVGLGKILGGAEAAKELLPLTPGTEALPGGGIFDIPKPPSPPGFGGLS